MRYRVYNGHMPAASKFAAVPSGTVLLTLLQLKAFTPCKIVEYGISFDGYAAATPIQVELLDTGAVFATVTASVDADVAKMDGEDSPVSSISGIVLGATATGFTATAEGVITTTKPFDIQFVSPTSQFVKQFPLGREPKIVIGNSTRLRVSAAASVNAICYIEFEF